MSPVANVYELLIQGVADYAIYMLTPDGHVVNWNSGAQRIKGYTSDEIVHTNVKRHALRHFQAN